MVLAGSSGQYEAWLRRGRRKREEFPLVTDERTLRLCPRGTRLVLVGDWKSSPVAEVARALVDAGTLKFSGREAR